MASPLLSSADPDPVIASHGSSGWLLTVEHAGRAIPSRLGALGLPDGELDRHIGWDIGALALAEKLQPMLDATLVAQRYSRLVIDCNRPRSATDLIPDVADETPVPGNTSISHADVTARWSEIHAPYHNAIAQVLPQAHSLLSVHSYDPRRRTDAGVRPWPIGLLWRKANPLADRLAKSLAEHITPLGLNQPYEIEDDGDYTIPVHAEPRALPHVLIEVRNDHLASSDAIERIASLLAHACQEAQ
jgi:predicted N-formylglutamate amidohydrolase